MMILETTFNLVMFYVLATGDIILSFSRWGWILNEQNDVVALVHMEPGIHLKRDWLVYQERY